VICNVANHQKMYPAALQFLMGPRTFAVSFDALAVGCGAAILLFRQGPAAHRFLSLSPILTGFVALMCVIVPHVFGKLHILGPLIVPFGQTLQACGIAGLILQSIVKPGWGLYRLLNTSILVWIGTLSYSLYIWQQLFCSQPRSFGWPDVWWMSFPGWFIPAFITACASYYLLERPLMGLRSRFRS
jgi:peptidoglycan/LPS O-acetylase OafA/YrhL